MKEIGGYFELELKKGHPYHHKAVQLSTARNCFEYILRTKKIKKVYIPHFTCEVMLEPIFKLGINFGYYYIDRNLEPVCSDQLLKSDFILYTNYFGIKQTFIIEFAKKYRNLIVDNSQGFFHFPVGNLDTFYSARKFFGVPDGAYLYTDNVIPETEIIQDYSYNRSGHLIKRIELGANEAYQLFLENEKMLYNQPIKKMSMFSRAILANTDYENSKAIRERNFLYLHGVLYDKNELKIDLSDFSGPMFYPFLYGDKKIRQYMIDHKIYVPAFWKNVFDTTQKDDFEQYLANYLIPLPIDQRYDISDMEYMIGVLKTLL